MQNTPDHSVSSILIVEDEALTAKDLQRCLERLGYAVPPIASSASEALELASTRRPDLVLMDIHLDGVADGIEAAQSIVERWGIPIVFLTAYADESTLQRAKQVGPYGYIVKPVRLEELRVTVAVSLHKSLLEKRLRERDRWYSTTLNAITDAVISVDETGTVTFMNRAAEKMTSVEQRSGVGGSIGSLFDRFPTIRPHAEAAAQLANESDAAPDGQGDGRFIAFPEVSLTSLRSDQRIVSDSIAQVIEHGTVLGAVMVSRDVTVQKQLQHSLLVSDRMASVGLLAAGVAHEINNPLSVVIANTSAVASALVDRGAEAGRSTSAAQLLELLQDSAAASTRIREIVRDIMLFARSEAPEQRNVDLNRVVTSTLRMAQNAIRFCGRVETDYGAMPTVQGSESRLGQVFLNLIVNAAHSTRKADRDEHVIRIASRTNSAGAAEVDIIDNGTGMSDETMRQLYTPFFTTKPVGMGTGLGLSICRRIVTDLGGEIDIDSDLGRGTTVRVTLPASSQNEPVKFLPTFEPVKTRARVLVIDDEPMIARVLDRLLSPIHDVSVFLDAREALAKICAGDRFDIILCDVMMPGMDGVDFHARLTEAIPEQAQRVVLLSGGGFTPRATAFFADGRIPRLEKPVGLEALESAIQERLSH